MAVPKARIRFRRPEDLPGKTYVIEPQGSDHKWYIIVNDGVIDEQLRPVEVFINSKDVTSHAWVSIVARLISAQLQQPGPFPAFILKEMLESYDLGGGYFIPGSQGKRAPSIVAHIGMVLEKHCKELKLI